MRTSEMCWLLSHCLTECLCAAQPTAEPLVSTGSAVEPRYEDDQDMHYQAQDVPADLHAEEDDGREQHDDDDSDYLDDSSLEQVQQEVTPPEAVKARWREAIRARLGVESERILVHDLGVYLDLTADRPWVQTMKLRWAINNTERDKEQLFRCACHALLHQPLALPQSHAHDWLAAVQQPSQQSVHIML